ncbi:MAG: SEC-C metal-binding domain-containing protein [Gammaproteobacteria bacterium]|nr:SEC-C metal-binding domain-containing protein [Gammaproteobacteria bacterium]
MVNSNLAQTGYENYYQMLSDNVRMEAYRRAIFKTVNHGDVVVDLGAGTGLLGIWALQAGAAKVYVIEKTAAIELAKEVARANNFSDKMVFIQENSMDVELPEKANVLLSETLGSFAVDENTLQFTQDAKARFLLEQGSLIPRSIDLFVAPIEDAKTYQKIDFWRHIPDIDFTPAFNLFTKKIMVELVNANGFLAKPVKLCHIDLTQPVSTIFQTRQYIKIDRPGTIHGVAGWFHVELCDGIAINTAPDSPQTHWKQAFFPFENAIEVIVDDVLDWSVQVGAKQENSDDTQITYNYRCTQLKNEPQPLDGRPVGRNDKCPCGSGKKYKKCCMG